MRIIERKQDVDLSEKVTVEMTLAELATISLIFGGMTGHDVDKAVDTSFGNIESSEEVVSQLKSNETYGDIFYTAYNFLEAKGVFK